MRSSLIVACLCTLFVTLGSVGAQAARKALVIGNDAYSEIARLERAVNDAWTIGDALAASGFAVERHANLRRRDFSVIFDRFTQNLSKGDEAAFFFAGHGVAIGGDNFLLPTDVPLRGPGSERLIRDESFALAELLESIARRGVRVTVAIVDACRDNPFRREGTRTVGGSRGLAAAAAPEGTFVMYSAAAGQTALDSLGPQDTDRNSVYVRTLAPLLQQPGLSLSAIARGVRNDVRSAARSVSHNQRPAYYDEMTDEFFLRPPVEGQQVAVVQTPVAAPVEAPREEPRFQTVPWDENVAINELMDIATDERGRTYAVGSVYGNAGGYLDLHGALEVKDGRGRTVWRRDFDMKGDNSVTAISTLPDGTATIAGSVTPSGERNMQFWAAQLDPNGKTLWERVLDTGDSMSSAQDIVRTQSGAFALAGIVRLSRSLSQAGLVAMLDGNGREKWRLPFADDGEVTLNAVAALPDGDIAVAGLGGNPVRGGLVARISPDGRLKWKRIIPHRGDLQDIIHLPSGHLAVVGSKRSSRDNSIDLWLAKFAMDGTTVQEATFGTNGEEQGFALALRADDALLVGGSTTSKGGGAEDGWLLHVDDYFALRIAEEKTFGTARDDRVVAVAPLPDGGVAIGGQQDTKGWMFTVSATPAARGAVSSDDFSGRCIKETRWSGHQEMTTSGDGAGLVYVGNFYCAREGSEPLFLFTCQRTDERLSVRASLAVANRHDGKTLPVTIRVDGRATRFNARGSYSEMADQTTLNFTIPKDHSLIERLAAGSRAVISADGKRMAIHLTDSREALERLSLCN